MQTDWDALGKWCREQEAESRALAANHATMNLRGFVGEPERHLRDADRYATLATLCEQRVRDEALAAGLRSYIEWIDKGSSLEADALIGLINSAADRLEGKA